MAYTKPSISAYNTSPPADDGSETEANKIKWSTIKTKITDPVKVLAEAINDATETAFNDLASTATDDGAALVGIEDAAGNFTSSTVEGALAELSARDSVNVLEYGAVADCVALTDASITSGDNTLTSPSNPFTSADVGKAIAVFNAGSTTTSLFTTIASYTSAGEVELTDAAGTTVSGVVAQFGTDNYTFFHAAIDAIHALGGGILKAEGKFFCSTKVQLRADNIVYDFRGAQFYGNNFSCLDDVTTTHKVDNVTGYGGEFNPIGDTAAYGGNVNYNGLAFVHCNNVRWYSPRVKARNGTRCMSIQTNSSHGTAPYVNATDIRIYDVGLFGDGDTHDGFDITSDANGTDEIQDVYVQGYVEGCKRGMNNSAGSSSLRHLRVNLDLTIKGATTIGAVSKYNVDSKQIIRVIDATTDGIDIRGPEGCDFELFCTGTGASLNDAILFVDNSADTTNTAKIHIGYDNTNQWTRGLVPTLHDLQIPHAYIDGAVTGVDTGGFRTIWGQLLFKNCTTTIDNSTLATDSFASPVIDLGTGANPKVIGHSNNRVGTNVGDADDTLTVGTDDPVQRWTTTLTAARTADLQTAGAYEGAEFHIIRSAAGAFNLNVTQDGGGTLKAMPASSWSTWVFDSANWIEKAYGAL